MCHDAHSNILCMTHNAVYTRLSYIINISHALVSCFVPVSRVTDLCTQQQMKEINYCRGGGGKQTHVHTHTNTYDYKSTLFFSLHWVSFVLCYDVKCVYAWPIIA